MIRLAFLWLLLACAPCLAQPVLDANVNTNITTGGTTATVSATTSAANELVIVTANLGTNATSGTLSPTIAGCSLSWTLLTHQSITYPPVNGMFAWYGFATSKLTACTITVTSNITLDDTALAQYALSGVYQAKPIDPNASLPVYPTTLGSTLGSCTAADAGGAFTTSNPHDIMFLFIGSTSSFVQNSTPCGSDTKFVSLLNNGGTRQALMYGSWRSFTTRQTNTLTGIAGAYGTAMYLQITAFTADPPPPAGGNVSLLGVQ